MMKKKGLFTLLLCVAVLSFLVSFVGCSAKEKTEDKIDTSLTKSESITVWLLNKNDVATAILDDAAIQFKKDRGIDVKIQYFENDPYKTKLKTAMGSGEGPDVFHSWGGAWLKQFVDENQVLDITELSSDFKNELSQAAWDLNTYDGKVYGVPYALAGTMIYYNKELFEKYNLSFPTNWDEMQNVAQTFLDNGVIPFALGNKSAWPGAMQFIYQYIRYGGENAIVSRLEDKGNGVFDKNAFISAGENIKTMVDEGWYPEGVNGINYDTGGSRMLFYSGQCAMILQTGSFSTGCKDEAPDFYKNNLGVAPFPTIAGGLGTINESLCGNNALSVSSHSKNPQAALDFIKYYTTNKEINEKNANDAGILVATKGIEINDPIVKKITDILNDSTAVQNFFDQGLPKEVAQVFNDSVQALFGKTMTPTEVYNKVEGVAQDLLNN